MAIAEGQLTWLVYIIGSAIDGKKTFMSNDEHDVIDGELILRVRHIQLPNINVNVNIKKSFKRFYN